MSSHSSALLERKVASFTGIALVIKAACNLCSDIPTLATLIDFSRELWVIRVLQCVLTGQITVVSRFWETFLELAWKLTKEWAHGCNILLRLRFFRLSLWSCALIIAAMDFFKNWKLVDTRIKISQKLFSILTVLIQTFQGVEFDNIEMSEKLLELLVFMSEVAVATIGAVLVVMELATLSLHNWLTCLWVYLWLSRMFICTILSKSTEACLEPVLAGLSPKVSIVGEWLGAFIRHLHVMAHLEVGIGLRWEAGVIHHWVVILIANCLGRNKGLRVSVNGLVAAALKLTWSKVKCWSSDAEIKAWGKSSQVRGWLGKVRVRAWHVAALVSRLLWECWAILNSLRNKLFRGEFLLCHLGPEIFKNFVLLCIPQETALGWATRAWLVLEWV